MNRIYFFIFFILVSYITPAQQSSLILTGISRPNNSFPDNGNNNARSIELYVVEDIIDLSVYGFATSNENAAGGQSNNPIQLTEDADFWPAGSFIYIARDGDLFEDLHGFPPDYESGALNFYGGNESGPGPICVIELLYSPGSWNVNNLQTIDFWANNSLDYGLFGGWSKRQNCFGPNAGPINWQYMNPVFLSDNGDLTNLYENFDIAEWSYGISDPNPIEFGTYEPCFGCTNPLADNYDINSNIENGSCVISDCTDPNAENYNSNATEDNGSCVYAGCVDPFFLEYYLQGYEADFDNGSCSNIINLGCFNSSACNYNENTNLPCTQIGEEISGFTFLGIFNDHGYYLSNEVASWDYANNYTNVLGGYLTSVTSEEEQNFIYNNVNSIIPNNYWIGLNDINNEGVFSWVNDDDFIFENWNTGEPNSGFDENYVEVFSDNSISPGFWNDAPGSVERYYVLELEDQDCCLFADGICQTCLDGVVLENDSDGDGICDWDDLGCQVTVQPIITNLCEGEWQIYLDFQYDTSTSIPGLDDITAFFISSGTLYEPEQSFVTTNSEYDLVYNINTPGDYIISFQSSSECNFGEFPISILESVDLSLTYSLDAIPCQGGFLTGFLDGPSGIYSVYVDGIYETDLSIGLENVVFDSWNGNVGSDCNGNVLFGNATENQTIALGGFSGLQIGDQIGAFYIHPTCGLTSGGDIEYDGSNTLTISVWADDPNTLPVEGFNPGDEIIWLVNSDGIIYNADINWNTSGNGLISGEYFAPAGLGATTSFSIGGDYEESFSVELSTGAHSVTVFDGSCLILEENDIFIEDSQSVNDAVLNIVDATCEDVNDGSITVQGLSENSTYELTLVLIGPNTTFTANGNSFENLPSGTYFINILDLTCDESFTDFDIIVGASGLIDDCGVCDSDPTNDCVLGCSDELACNFDPNATDNDSCDYSCLGCDGIANSGLEFDICGICGGDNTSCIGCTDFSACNYNSVALFDDGSCDYSSCVGCTDEQACNYNAIAIISDNSLCDYSSCAGCTDEQACNYDLGSTIDNGLCEYLTCTGCTDEQACNYDLGSTIDNNSCEYLTCAGCTDEQACNYSSEATISDECFYTDGICDTCENNIIIDNDLDNDGICNDDEILGCTNPLFDEYNPAATENDGSCLTLSLIGCTDEEACNYNPAATEEDGLCLYADEPCEECFGALVWFFDLDGDGICDDEEISGCQDVLACNYNEDASDNDDSCIYVENNCDICSGEIDGSGYIINNDSDNDTICDDDEIIGCQDPLGCNYNQSATEQGACLYPDDECETCENGLVVNNDVDNDGVCDWNEIIGCTNPLYEEYNPLATEDDGSCVTLTVYGCTDEEACNYNVDATDNDNSCIYPEDICETCENGLVVNNDEDNDGICDWDEIELCDQFDFVSSSDVSQPCEEGDFGSISITIDSLFINDDLMFQWSGFDYSGNNIDLGEQINNEDLVNLDPGVYTYIIDNGLCVQQGFETVNVGQNLEFVVQEPYFFDNPFNQYSIQCFGDTTASMYLEFIGGQPPYDLYISVNGVLGPVDFDITDGQIINEPFPYTYDDFYNLWNGPNNDIDVTSIGGSYQFIIQAADGQCSVVSDVFNFNEPNLLTLDVINIDVDCFDIDSEGNQIPDGQIILNISGGAPPYNIQFDNTSDGVSDYETNWGGNDLPINNLESGTYNFTISDLNGCVILDTIIIQDIDPIFISSYGDQYNCFNPDSDGNQIPNAFLNFEFSGGTPPYNYQFLQNDENGIPVAFIQGITNNSIEFNDLQVGDYYIGVTDSNGCSALNLTLPDGGTISENSDGLFYINGPNDSPLTIVQLDEISINYEVTQPLICYGDSVAYIDVLINQPNYSGSFDVYVDSSGVLIDSIIEYTPSGAALNYCFFADGDNQSIALTGLGNVFVNPFETDLQDGDIIGLFQQVPVSPAAPSGYLCVGGITDNNNLPDCDYCFEDIINDYPTICSDNTLCPEDNPLTPYNEECDAPGCGMISSFSQSIPYQSFPDDPNDVQGDLNSIWTDAFGNWTGGFSFTAFASDPTIPVCNPVSNPLALYGFDATSPNNDIYIFVQRDGITYSTVVEFAQSSGFTQQYAVNGLSAIESIYLDEPLLDNGDGSLEVCLINPSVDDIYNITVFNSSYNDSISCGTSLDSINILAPEEPINVFLADSSNYNGFGVSCFGETDGFVDVLISGGFGSYTLSLYNSFPFDNPIANEIAPSCPIFNECNNVIESFGGDLAPGTYYLTTSDSLGCSTIVNGNFYVDENENLIYYYEFSITEPEIFNVSTSINNVSCYNGSDGFVDLNLTGGATPYIYNPSDFIGLEAGVYQGIIYDANYCYVEVNFEIQQPEELVLSIESVSDYDGFGVSCFGANDGFINLAVNGGTPYLGDEGYEFIGLDSLNNNLSSGSYSVYVIDSLGCESNTIDINLIQPDQIELVSGLDPTTYISDYDGFGVSCAGEDDGQIGVVESIEVVGGIGPFNYTWYLGSIAPDNIMTVNLFGNIIGDDPSSLGADGDGLPGNTTYWLEIIDTGNLETDCPITIGPFVISLPPSLGIEPSITIPMNVDYDNDSVEDNWIQEVPLVFVLQDENEYVTGELEIYGDYGVSCNGANNGFINIEISGGSSNNYTYYWEAFDLNGNSIDLGNQSDNQDIFELNAGTYIVSVIEDNYYQNDPIANSGCFVTQTFILNEPAEPLDVDVQILYYDSNINSEDYSSDVNSPLIDTYNTIDDYDYLTFGVSCNGAADGQINISISGGVELYNYKLFNSSNQVVDSLEIFSEEINYAISNLEADTYTLIVYDYNYLYDELNAEIATDLQSYINVFPSNNYLNCVFEIEIVITEPDLLLINNPLINNVSCNGNEDGSINVSVSGGIGSSDGDYIYSWSGTDFNGDEIILAQDDVQDLSGVPAGEYLLTVYDNNYFCEVTELFLVTEPDPIDFELTEVVYSDYCDDELGFNISCFIDENNDGLNDITDGEIVVNSLFPSTNNSFSYYWKYNNEIIDFENGTPEILFPSILEVGNGNEVPNLAGLTSGYYTLYVQDNITGCENIFGPHFISQPQFLNSNIDNVTISDLNGDLIDNDYNGYGVSCIGSFDGSISVQIEGGSGVYNVLYFDENGIEIANINQILEPVPCEWSSDVDNDGILNENDSDIDGDGVYLNGECIDNCNNSALYNLEGNCIENCADNDDLPYYPGLMSTVVELDELPAGIYSIVINDGLCQPIEISGIELIAPPEILQFTEAFVDSVSCNGDSDGSILTSFYGGLPNNWNWGLYSTDDSYLDGELIATGVNLIEPGEIYIDNLSAGFYRLDIFDINGFSVTNDDFSDLGLAADSQYHFMPDGCSASLDIQIFEPPAIDTLNMSIVHPCYNYQTIWYSSENGGIIYDTLVNPSNGLLNLDLIGENPPFDVSLVNTSSDDTMSLGFFDNNLEIQNLTSGVYNLEITDTNQCVSNFDILLGWDYVSNTSGVPSPMSINILDVNMPDCEYSVDGSILFPEISSELSFIHYWGVDLNFDGEYDYTTEERDLTELSIGIYSLHIIDDIYGCEMIYDYILQSEFDCVEVPTGFSPNGDGINDYWVIGAMEEYQDVEVQVYNRWGDLVFYSDDNKDYWDGTYKGKHMPTADYFYIIKDRDGISLSHGRVTLRR